MTREEIIKSALKFLIRKQTEQGSWGYADNNDNEISWNEVIRWVDQQPCGDCISRQAVIDTIETDCSWDMFNEWGSRTPTGERIINAIKSVPSVEPEQNLQPTCNQLATDCISRKAVIDRINRLIEAEKKQGTDDWGYGRERVNAYEAMLHFVKSEYLYPSVEPERCGDCISRESALEVLDDYAEDIECGNWGTAYSKARTSMCELSSVKTERKPGKWFLLDECANEGWYCDQCNKKVFRADFSNTMKKYKFCPNCGAKMEVADDT